MSEEQSRNQKNPKAIVLGVAILAIAVLLVVFVRAYFVPSGAMEPTISEGDRVIALNAIGYSPAVGDIVTYEQNGDTYMRRVIAVGGQKVEIADGTVTVDGKDSPWQGEGDNSIDGVWELENGELFVLGDNRSNSEDSRYTGPVSVSSVKAHVVGVFFPFDHAKGL